ncbi:MAG: hypothetical protein IIX68_07935 [Clostridia bacterium]|nr:hypothetical protein [Clostridia bacterium]
MKKALTLILIAALLVACLCGCNPSASSDAPQTEKKPSNRLDIGERRSNVKLTDENGQEYYLMGDFENYYEATQVKYSAGFGKVDMISKAEQPDKVTNGEGSIHVTVAGNESTWHKRRPNIRFSTTNAFFNATTDFSKLDRFTLDVYNCQDYEVELRFVLSTQVYNNVTFEDRILTDPNYEYSTAESYYLAPNTWTTVEVPADVMRYVSWDTEGKAYLVTGAEALSAVGAFVFTFDRGELHENPQEFYFDNARAYLKSE